MAWLTNEQFRLFDADSFERLDRRFEPERLKLLGVVVGHKHPKVIACFARHPCVTFHFTPTSVSWLNAVEGFFAALTKRRLKRGAFLGVVDLLAAMNRHLGDHNTDPKPFRCKADPDKIIAAAAKGHQTVGFNPLAALLIENLEPPLNRKRCNNFSGSECLQVIDPEIEKQRQQQILA